MIPIRDHNPSATFPIVTYCLLALNVLVFFAYFPGATQESIFQFFTAFALVPAEIMAGDSYFTFITAMFLHGSWMHLLGNMLFLYIFGDNLEDRFGRVKFLIFYLLSGIVASAAQIFSNPDSIIPNVGASGAIAGVMGAYLFLFPRAKVDVIIPQGFTIITIPAFYMLGYWFLMQLILGTQSLGYKGGGVAYWAHAGGFLAGLFFAFLDGRKRS